MFKQIKRQWQWHRLKKPEYRFLFENHETEVVSLDCETTGLKVSEAEILTIGAVKIRGNRLLTSERLELLIRPRAHIHHASIAIHQIRPMDTQTGMEIEEAIPLLLDFIGGRPLVGYYLEFDIAMVNKYIKPFLGIGLPNQAIEVSGLYYDYKFKQNPGRNVDLHFEKILEDLDIPILPAHDAINDAIMAGMAYMKLKSL